MRLGLKRMLALLLSLALLCGALSACAGGEIEGTAKNDILAFESNAENKPIIRIGSQYYAPNNDFALILQKRFPDYFFVLDNSLRAGAHSVDFIGECIDHGIEFDMVVAGQMPQDPFRASDYFIDLSTEEFLENFLLSTLNQASVDGHIYAVPGTSTLMGIAYNTELFASHGWEVPTTTDEFFALCRTIKAAGIEPFAVCAKYASALNTMLAMMCYDQLFQTPEDAAWIEDISFGTALYSKHMEPMYELAKRFYDEGVISADYFSASLTKMRQAFWNGEYAMLCQDSKIFDYAKSENAPFEVGYMPFPTADGECSGYQIAPEYNIYLPKHLEKDSERLALMKEILTFLCSEEGQNAQMQGTLCVSNMKGIKLQDSPTLKYYQEAYDKGNLYPAVDYYNSRIDIVELQAESMKTIFEGGGVEEAIALMDESLAAARSMPNEKKEYAVIANAEKDFTMLETSCYMADALREAAGTELGLMVNGGYFRSNLSVFWKGEIKNDPADFVMKGVGAEDYLTVYKLTGAQLKALLEHPVVNGQEIDAFVAVSGLKIEYAPWNERGSRVVKIAMEDGTPLDDARLYTVAAWAGAIDEAYISQTVQTLDALGSFPDILFAALEKDGTVKPDIAGRVKLDWPKGK